MSDTVSEGQTGITIIMTSIQLAALLQDVPLTRMEVASNRLFGALSVIGGAVDLVASVPLWLAPEPTLLTKVVAGGLDVIGGDMVATGARQIWTGRTTKSFTSEVLARSLRSLGVDPEVADRLARLIQPGEAATAF